MPKMIDLVRSDSNHTDFINLVKILDADLAIRDGDDHAFYDQFNKLDHIKHVVVLYEDNLPIACGAIKTYDDQKMEIKRMFTMPENRGQGLAVEVLKALEYWASELGYIKCILETGIKQPEAIRLYEKTGYTIMANYGPYSGIKTSYCFEKNI